MIYFLTSLLATVLGGVFVTILLDIPERRRRRQHGEAVDACNRYAHLARNAKTTEEYEFYMKQAVHHIDRAADIREGR